MPSVNVEASVQVLRQVLCVSFARALDSLELSGRVARAIPRLPGTRPVAILAVGKAARAMACGALSAVGDRVALALVVEPDGVRGALPRDPRVQVLVASHPDPDARSVAAARRALEVVHASELTLALVSGGASSLLCLPRGVTLARYVRVVSTLLLGGATVREVNVVRRHMCAAKGGGLARQAGGPVHTLIASDVIGGGMHDVGSGPTVADPSTRSQARAVLRRFAPRLALPPLYESLKATTPAARSLRARFVASPDDLARAVARELEDRRDHCSATRILAPSTASVAELAHEYLARARALRPGEALVRAAEPSLRVQGAGPGRGGRSTHLALLLAPDLPDGVVFLAGASDGVDGASGTAGAAVDATLLAHASRDAIARALACFDSAPLLVSAGMGVAFGPTGNNLADVHVLARLRRS
jgi:glycerate 2-kinase